MLARMTTPFCEKSSNQKEAKDTLLKQLKNGVFLKQKNSKNCFAVFLYLFLS